MKKAVTAALAACVCASAAFAVPGKAGTTTGEFLRLAAGARPAAMGEAFTALADDVHALYFNPAGLARLDGRQALLAHTLWFVDVNHDYAAYAQSFKGGALGASFTYLSTTFERRAGDTESPDGSGTVGEMAVSLSYARTLYAEIDGGLTVKYLSSDLDGTRAASPAFDLGLRRSFRDGRFAAAFAARNLGGSLDYGSGGVALGSAVSLGLASRGFLLEALSLGLDAETIVNNGAFSANFGAEYVYAAGADWSVSPRLGFKSNSSVLTAGLGIGFKSYRFDYALDSQASLGTANRVSFSAKF